MQNLDEKTWAPVGLTSMFDLQRGRESNMAMLEDGDVPLISAKNGSNGLKGFVKTSKKLINGECISLNNDGNGGAGLAYYQPANMALDTHVTALLPKDDIGRDVMLFTSECISGLHEFFGHGLSISNPRAKATSVMLPVTDDGEPDYEYMEHYAAATRKAKLAQYREYVQKRIDELGNYVEISSLDEKEWKPFLIESLFDSIVPGKISNASQLVKDDFGSIEYIAATNRNNGVLYFLQENDQSIKKLQDGNCIGFIKDGNGSAGYAIYKQEKFASTVNVIYGYASWLNKYSGLFFVAAQDKIEDIYGHGYKRKQEHLKADKIMLPVNETGKPDFEYMEQYSKNMMLRKYQQYLVFLDTKR